MRAELEQLRLHPQQEAQQADGRPSQEAGFGVQQTPAPKSHTTAGQEASPCEWEDTYSSDEERGSDEDGGRGGLKVSCTPCRAQEQRCCPMHESTTSPLPREGQGHE